MGEGEGSPYRQVRGLGGIGQGGGEEPLEVPDRAADYVEAGGVNPMRVGGAGPDPIANALVPDMSGRAQQNLNEAKGAFNLRQLIKRGAIDRSTGENVTLEDLLSHPNPQVRRSAQETDAIGADIFTETEYDDRGVAKTSKDKDGNKVVVGTHPTAVTREQYDLQLTNKQRANVKVIVPPGPLTPEQEREIDMDVWERNRGKTLTGRDYELQNERTARLFPQWKPGDPVDKFSPLTPNSWKRKLIQQRKALTRQWNREEQRKGWTDEKRKGHALTAMLNKRKERAEANKRLDRPATMGPSVHKNLTAMTRRDERKATKKERAKLLLERAQEKGKARTKRILARKEGPKVFNPVIADALLKEQNILMQAGKKGPVEKRMAFEREEREAGEERLDTIATHNRWAESDTGQPGDAGSKNRESFAAWDDFDNAAAQVRAEGNEPTLENIQSKLPAANRKYYDSWVESTEYDRYDSKGTKRYGWWHHMDAPRSKRYELIHGRPPTAEQMKPPGGSAWFGGGGIAPVGPPI